MVRQAEDERKTLDTTDWNNIGRHVEVFVDAEETIKKEAKIFGLTDTVVNRALNERRLTNSTDVESNALTEEHNAETTHYYKVYVPPFHTIMEKEPKDVKFVFEGQNFSQMTSVKDEAPMAIILLPGLFILMAMRAQTILVPVLASPFLYAHDKDQRLTTQAKEAEIQYAGEMAFAGFYEALAVFACGCLFATHFSLIDQMKKIGMGVQYMKTQINEQNPPTSDDVDGSHTCFSQFREDHKNFALMAHDHRYSMTYAGLLGMWSYVLSNMLTSLFGLVLEIVTNSSKKLGLKILGTVTTRVRIYEKLGWLSNCTTVLCICNITIILQMQELQQKSALGKNAPKKFFPIRTFLFITQFQPFILDHIAKYFTGPEFDKMYSKFWNVILINFWCALFIVWNCLIWRSTPLHRKEAKEAAKSVPLLQK